MTTLYNPALHEESRNRPMQVVPLLPRESLLNWLESSGRFRANDVDEFPDAKVPEELDDFLEPEMFSSDDDDDDEELE